MSILLLFMGFIIYRLLNIISTKQMWIWIIILSLLCVAGSIIDYCDCDIMYPWINDWLEGILYTYQTIAYFLGFISILFYIYSKPSSATIGLQGILLSLMIYLFATQWFNHENIYLYVDGCVLCCLLLISYLRQRKLKETDEFFNIKLLKYFLFFPLVAISIVLGIAYYETKTYPTFASYVSSHMSLALSSIFDMFDMDMKDRLLDKKDRDDFMECIQKIAGDSKPIRRLSLRIDHRDIFNCYYNNVLSNKKGI